MRQKCTFKFHTGFSVFLVQFNLENLHHLFVCLKGGLYKGKKVDIPLDTLEWRPNAAKLHIQISYRV